MTSTPDSAGRSLIIYDPVQIINIENQIYLRQDAPNIVSYCIAGTKILIHLHHRGAPNEELLMPKPRRTADNIIELPIVAQRSVAIPPAGSWRAATKKASRHCDHALFD